MRPLASRQGVADAAGELDNVAEQRLVAPLAVAAVAAADQLGPVAIDSQRQTGAQFAKHVPSPGPERTVVDPCPTDLVARGDRGDFLQRRLAVRAHDADGGRHLPHIGIAFPEVRPSPLAELAAAVVSPGHRGAVFKHREIVKDSGGDRFDLSEDAVSADPQDLNRRGRVPGLGPARLPPRTDAQLAFPVAAPGADRAVVEQCNGVMNPTGHRADALEPPLAAEAQDLHRMGAPAVAVADAVAQLPVTRTAPRPDGAVLSDRD